MSGEDYKGFFDDEDMLAMVDLMARRYGVLPSDILRMTVFDFSLNMAVMMKMLCIDKRQGKGAGEVKPMTAADLKGLGISHTVVKKGKG
jgi:hypothetical protein